MRRSSWISVIAVLAVIAAGLGWFALGIGPQVRTVSAPPVAPAPSKPAPPPQAQAERAPSFDAVHVGPDGNAVIAGRAAPGAEVTILDQGKPIGQVTADPNGEWVLIPDQKLAPGARELSLSARNPGAGAPVASTKSLAILVPQPEPGSTPQGPVAVLLPQSGDEAARPVQMPGARAAHKVTLDIVEYDASGRVVLSGRADPGARIAVGVNERPVGSATADDRAAWTAEIGAGIPVGRYRLRLDATGRDGAPAGGVSFDLRRAAPGTLGDGGYLAVVPGNTLWHLAFHSYGEGLRYVELYRANRDKIENPDRIYPGELLALPARR